VNHGNEDTYREMTRVKRSVLASYSTSVNFAAAALAGMVSAGPQLTAAAAAAKGSGAMAELEAAVTERAKEGLSKGFVRAGGEAAVAAPPANKDEISLDDDDDDESSSSSSSESEGEGEGEGGAVSKPSKSAPVVEKAVPEAVFGGITAEALGAKARFKAKQSA
jgi:pre-mRNA-splicing factor SYF1